MRTAVRYASEEHMRIEMAHVLLRQESGATIEARLRLLGELMLQSHAAYAECGLDVPACDTLVELARQHGLYGAKMTGGGGGGIVALLGASCQQDAVEAVATEYAGRHGGAPGMFSGSSNGADLSGLAMWEPENTLRGIMLAADEH